jgi:hypothetical protein
MPKTINFARRYYLSTDVSMAIIHGIVLDVIFGYINNGVSILALELFLTSTWLGVAENRVGPERVSNIGYLTYSF